MTDYSESHIRAMKKFESRFLKKVYEAIRTDFIEFADVLKSKGLDEAIRQLDRIVINKEIGLVIRDIYAAIGLYAAKKTIREINRSAQEQKAFGFDEELVRAIITYFSAYLLNKAVIPISESTKQQILDIIKKGQIEGWGVDKMAFELESSDLTLWRARMIVRTESAKANFYGQKLGRQQATWESEKTWITANDHRVRHSHQFVNRVSKDENAKFPVPQMRGLVQTGFDYMDGPGDINGSAGNVINCFPSDTLVEGQFVGGQRLKFSGQVVEIITASGQRLSVTPNHPIFTTKGIVHANGLIKGDYVFSNIKKGKNVSGLIDDYIQKKPVFAKNLFRTLKNFGSSKMMMICALDFNGDAKFGDGYVNIVDMNGELQFDLETMPEDIGKFSFKSTHLERFFVSRFCSLNQFTFASFDSSDGLMSSDDLFFSSGFPHLRPFQYFSIGTSTNWNASRFESSHQSDSNDAAFIGKLLHGNTGIITIDKIVEIRNRYYSGHVYDFSTLSGAILANNIYISNCRCTLIHKAKRDENGRLIKKRNVAVVMPGNFVNTNQIIVI